MLTDVDPLTFSDHSTPATGPAFKPVPRRWRRDDRPESQLTGAGAVAMLTGGRLTPRDIAVLRTIWMYGVMTTDQITRLVFHPLTGPSRPLNYLYQVYCLNRAWRGMGHDFVYSLDTRGRRQPVVLPLFTQSNLS